MNIPNSITSIGDLAFRGCSSLTSLSIPSSVTFLGISPFYGCTGLTSIKVEEGNIIYDSRNNCNAIIKTDDNELITGCNNTLIPGDVSSIAFGAFSCCSGLTSVTIPNGVTSIGNDAFEGCTGLTSITIPSSVTSIGEWFTFCDCSGLNSIIVEEGNTVYDSRDNCNAIIRTADNKLIYGCNNTVIPNNVTSIGNYAFSGCSGLTSITIPNGVTSIESHAFYGCSSLTSIKIPNGVTSIERGSFQGCSGLTSITIPNNVTSIAELSFNGCSNLTSVIIGKSVTSIGYNVFSNCMSLKDFYCYAENVPETDNTAFDNSNIEDVTLYVPAALVSAYQAVEPWKNFKEIVALSTQEDDTDDANYLPFVEGGKQWHVVRSDNDSGCHLENYMMNEEAVKDGKTYIKMSRSEDDLDVIYDTGLFREEDRKIYIFDDERQEEHLMFDYSLKEGDTYETFSYDEEKMVTYKVLSVDDYTEGPQVRREVYDEKTGNLITHSRYLQKWTVCRTDDNSIQKTWIEGVGSLEGPLENLHDVVLPDLSKDYLAYVEKYSGYLYLPFSFYDTLNKQAHGCDLPTSESNKEYDDELNHLTYELEGDRLHVYGEVFGNCGPNQYAYFYEKPTDDPLVHRIEFEIQEVEPLYWCKGLYATDFYVPGSFDPNINYIVVDNNGEEHPVINKTQEMAYRPFVEDGKVWKVGSTMIRDNLVKMVEYYYFDGDTIIDGKTCKQMMCQRYVNPEYPDYAIVMQYPLLQYVGAWYEENKKVYLYNAIGNKMLMYDFSFDDYATLQIHGQSYVIGPKQAGGMKGFKGVYRDVMMLWDEEQNIYNTTWLEGVGGIDGPTVSVYLGEENHALFLMSCTVGDEVIYLNDEYEDGATPAEARKRRIDFTHTIKIQPKTRIKREKNDACIGSSEREVARPKVKARTRNGAEESMYGEYNDQQLCINLDPLDDTYLVSITSESGKPVYEKEINAGNIVGLNINISSYVEGRYTVIVENSRESFKGEFGAQTTGIKDVRNKRSEVRNNIYNLQGQRLDTLQKGLNIVNGQKVFVK